MTVFLVVERHLWSVKEIILEVKANRKWTCNIKITAFDFDGNIKDITEIKNLLVTVGLGMVVDAWQTAAFDSEIKDMALGRDNTAPDLTDTTLGNETFRMVFTSQAEVTATSLLSVAVVPAASAVGLIEEIGWFAGAAADGVNPSGILVSRVLYNRTKTALESLSIERTDTIAEG